MLRRALDMVKNSDSDKASCQSAAAPSTKLALPFIAVGAVYW